MICHPVYHAAAEMQRAFFQGNAIFLKKIVEIPK
jgi:hypothetical protein